MLRGPVGKPSQERDLGSPRLPSPRLEPRHSQRWTLELRPPPTLVPDPPRITSRASRTSCLFLVTPPRPRLGTSVHLSQDPSLGACPEFPHPPVCSPPHTHTHTLASSPQPVPGPLPSAHLLHLRLSQPLSWVPIFCIWPAPLQGDQAQSPVLSPCDPTETHASPLKWEDSQPNPQTSAQPAHLAPSCSRAPLKK